MVTGGNFMILDIEGHPKQLSTLYIIIIIFYFFLQASALEPGSVGPGGGNTSEGVLANFFNSLLSKKTGQPGTPSNQIKPTTGLDDCKYKISKLFDEDEHSYELKAYF